MSKNLPKKEYAVGQYDHLHRFISYYFQIKIVTDLKPKSILEIGVGNKTVSSYLKNHDFTVTTCDLEPDLKPDHIADVRHLPFRDNQFDTIMICEVLEHLPWNDVEIALNELHRVSSRYVVLSIPYSCWATELIINFKLPYIAKILHKNYIRFLLRIPLFFKNFSFNGEHYWEMGRKKYSKNKVRSTLSKRFHIVSETTPTLNPYHYFFVLEKK